MEDTFTNILSFLNHREKLSYASTSKTNQYRISKYMQHLYSSDDYIYYIYLTFIIFKRWYRASYKKKKIRNSWEKKKIRNEILLFS